MGTRRKFTDEFKRESARLARKPGNSMTGVAKEIGVERRVLAAWVRKFAEGVYEADAAKPLKSASQAELEQLRRKLSKVKMERDILKKALGYFAKDPT